MIWPTILMALREIGRKKLRSALTTLGIVIGVAAVIAMVTLGQGTTEKVRADIARMGDNLLAAMPGSNRRGPATSSAPPFTLDDARVVARDLSGAVATAAIASRNALVVYGNQNRNVTVFGSTNDYLAARNMKLSSGRSFNETELRGSQPVCILGATTGKSLFAALDPIGATIRIGKVSCEVIGSVQAKGQSTFGNDPDDFVLMPLSTFQRRVAGKNDVNAILVSAVSGTMTPKVKLQLESLLRERRHIEPGQADDFIVMDMKEISETLSSVTGALTALLGAIAAVSLLVGGIGIMNIMLVAVTERTREIGIRLAIGAGTEDVLLQFLIEAVLLSLIGGVLGIALGLGASFGAARAIGLPWSVAPEIVVVSFVFSAAIGIAFGYFPARRAAHLNPIESLRHE
jgi:putative ABC transport system permease protein